MKKIPGLVILALFLITTLACNLTTLRNSGSATPVILADTFFSGHAYIDTNGNGELDASDPPLEGARFTCAGFGGETGADGVAVVVIPGGWDKPVEAQMTSPSGSGYTLVSPNVVTLQSPTKTRADFLFAPPLVTPTNQADLIPTPSPLQIDLTYCTTSDGVKLTMDLYQPRKMTAPAPAVLYVHGGGWTGGDKSDGAGLLFKEALVRSGYIMAAINYRLAPKYTFPAQIEDVKCAVRHLRANAAIYNIDPERIGAIGGSAGGHLVSLLGASDKEVGWDSGENSDQSSRVQAVVDMFGPSDLKVMQAGSSRRYGLLIFNASSLDDPLLQTYSPVTYITPDDPPFLILHGDRDEVVPLEQSQILYDKLEAAGVPVELVVVKNAGHGFRPVDGDIQPSLPELVKMVADFFDKYLK
jgi:acetyl esterase/lipase